MRLDYTMTAAAAATTLWVAAVLLCGGCSEKSKPAEGRAMQAGNPIQPAVTGDVRYRERMALPPDAEVYVMLEDVSRADAPATVVATQRIPTGGR